MSFSKLFSLCSLLLLAGGCLAATAERPSVVVSIKPLALILDDLAGEWLDVQMLLGENQEPHHVALSVSQRKKLGSAELLVWVGPGMESFLEKPVSQLNPKDIVSLQSIAHGAGVDLLEHDHHYWLQPILVEGLYKVLGDTLAARYPDKKAIIENRLVAVLRDWDVLTSSISSRFAEANSAAVIVDHQAYSYFAGYFGVDIAGALVDESGVAEGAKTLARLSQLSNVSCVVVEQFPPTRRARKMAGALGVPLVAIDPLGYAIDAEKGFIGLFDAVANGFLQCLNSGDETLSGDQF